MATTPTIRELHFPLAGVNRRLDYGAALPVKGPYPTPWAVNCRPQDVFERRLRGGSRPGLALGTGTITIPSVVCSQNRVQVYDPPTRTMVSVSATSGSLPDAFILGTIYRGRLLLGGADNVVYASRKGNVGDWDYSAVTSDSARPTFFQLSEDREIGRPATALIPDRDILMLAATAGSLWTIHGDPVTGTMRNVSRNVGCVGPAAWTMVDDTAVFLSAEGLYSCQASGEGLKPLSHDKVPDELRGASASTLLGYHHDERGVYIFSPGGNYHWFYDLTHGGFWPFTTNIVPNQAAIIDGGLVLALNGVPVTVGGSESITSHVLIGPLRTSGPTRMGRALKIQATIAAESGYVRWNIIGGDSAEQAAQRGVAAILGDSSHVGSSGTFSGGRSHLFYPRARSAWFVLWLSATSPWAYESVVLETVDAGMWR